MGLANPVCSGKSSFYVSVFNVLYKDADLLTLSALTQYHEVDGPLSQLSDFLLSYLRPEVIFMLFQSSPLALSTLSYDDRLVLVYETCNSHYYSQIFWTVLSQPQLDASCLIRLVAKDDYTGYESLVQRLALTLSDPECLDWKGWRSLLKSTVLLDGLRVSFEHGCFSPMLTYLGLNPDHEFEGKLAQFAPHYVVRTLQNWAHELVLAGQNLLQYGQWEKRFVSEQVQYPFFFGPLSAEVRVVGFEYGEFPQDWRIWFSTPADEYTGEFWAGVEEDERELMPCLPGAWPTMISQPAYYSNLSYWSHWVSDSRRRRRRFIRYMGRPPGDEGEVFPTSFRKFNAGVVLYFKQRKAKILKDSEERGLSPPY